MAEGVKAFLKHLAQRLQAEHATCDTEAEARDVLSAALKGLPDKHAIRSSLKAKPKQHAQQLLKLLNPKAPKTPGKKKKKTDDSLQSPVLLCPTGLDTVSKAINRSKRQRVDDLQQVVAAFPSKYIQFRVFDELLEAKQEAEVFDAAAHSDMLLSHTASSGSQAAIIMRTLEHLLGYASEWAMEIADDSSLDGMKNTLLVCAVRAKGVSFPTDAQPSYYDYLAALFSVWVNAYIRCRDRTRDELTETAAFLRQLFADSVLHLRDLITQLETPEDSSQCISLQTLGCLALNKLPVALDVPGFVRHCLALRTLRNLGKTEAVELLVQHCPAEPSSVGLWLGSIDSRFRASSGITDILDCSDDAANRLSEAVCVRDPTV